MYLDLLLILNLLLNYFLLLITAKIFRHRPGLLRLAGGALLGAPAVLAALWPLHYLLTLAVLLLAPLAMVMAAFWPVRRLELLLLWGGFFLVSFMTGGAALAAGQLFTPVAKPAVMGDALLLAAACLLLYLLLGCLQPYMEEKKWLRLWELELTISWRDRRKTVTAFLDTGNRLRDPVGKRPVIIVDFRSLEGLLPDPLYRRLADPEADLW
ncbi:MAG TPA: sigma-E processing peptidase SpoIIGA, partial [Bacillota bacterium]|nr:sigma-E processing peptidase SpoIIGA [Bacillota bacterium]